MEIKNKIRQTNDFIEFKNLVLGEYFHFKNSDLSSPKRPLSDFFNNKNIKIINLYGEAGTGKTEYLHILEKELGNIKFTSIKSLSELENNNECIYVLDAINEMPDDTVTKLEKYSKDKNKKFILICASWEKLIFGRSHKIQPNIIETLGENVLEFTENMEFMDFSPRELTLMAQVKKKNRILKKESHQFIWKAFENIFQNKEQKDFYKKMAYSNPVYVDKDNLINKESKIFEELMHKHIFQYNKKKNRYVFSHPGVSASIFYRRNGKNIEEINCNKYIEIIRGSSTAFLLWQQAKRVPRNKVIQFLKENKIETSVNASMSIYEIKDKDDYEFIKIDVSTSKKLLKYKFGEQLIYEYFLKEKFVGEEKPSNDDKNNMLITIINAISVHTDFSWWITQSLNNMLYSDIQKTLILDNSTKRKQFLNLILFRMLAIYGDEKISALKKSELINDIYMPWDFENRLSLKQFYYKCLKELKNRDKIYEFDAFLNSSISKDSVLNLSHSLKKFDPLFNCSRNGRIDSNTEFDFAHRTINLWIAEKFEPKLLNTLNSENFRKNYNAIELGIGWGEEYSEKEEESSYFINYFNLLYGNNVANDPNTFYNKTEQIQNLNLDLNDYYEKIYQGKLNNETGVCIEWVKNLVEKIEREHRKKIIYLRATPIKNAKTNGKFEIVFQVNKDLIPSISMAELNLNNIFTNEGILFLQEGKIWKYSDYELDITFCAFDHTNINEYELNIIFDNPKNKFKKYDLNEMLTNEFKIIKNYKNKEQEYNDHLEELWSKMILPKNKAKR